MQRVQKGNRRLAKLIGEGHATSPSRESAGIPTSSIALLQQI